MMQRDINITIKLEGLTPFHIKVPIEKEQHAREAQRYINHLYNSWNEKLAPIHPLELMGKIAFQMARNFLELSEQVESMEHLAIESEKSLDDLLLDME